MSLTGNFVHSVTVSRLITSGGIKEAFSVQPGTVDCLIMPLDDQAEAIEGLAFGKTFRLMAAYGANIQEGDKLVDNLSREFRVKGTKAYDFGTNPHMVGIITMES